MKDEDYIDRCLEVNKLFEEGVKLKHIGDNLRSYPVIVAFALAVFYLWQQPKTSFIPGWAFQSIAVLWGAWVVWFSFLTAVNSGFLLVAVVVDVLKPHYDKRPRLKSFAAAFIGVTAAVFMFGALFVSIALFSAVRR